MKSQRRSPRAAAAQGCSAVHGNKEEKERHKEIQKYFPNKRKCRDKKAVFFGLSPGSPAPIGFP